jgi:RNA polymerase sigma factor (sigma-70 family)
MKPNKVFFWPVLAVLGWSESGSSDKSVKNDCLTKRVPLHSSSGMESLIELIRQYRRAKTLEQELQIAEKIIKWVSPRLAAFLYRACRRPSLVDDLLQDTSVKIFKGLRKFRGHTEGEAWSWCYTIARNTVSSHFRTNKIEEHLEPFDTETLWKTINASAEKDPLSPAERQDLEDAMTLLGKVKPPCRGYLWSHHIRGLDYKEIGKIYGLTYNAARMQVKRCLKLAIELAAKHL